MDPLIAPVTRTAKPTLVPAKGFLVQRGGVHRLIQTEELGVNRNRVCIGVLRISNRDPRSGDLISLF
jgi:hypothetical protein